MAKKKFFDENGNEVKAKEKKPFYKKWWFWLIIVIIIGGAALGSTEEEASENTEASEEKPVEKDVKEEIVEEPKEDVVEEEKIIENDDTNDDDLSKINEEIAISLEQNQGWALGTIDSDGNEIENGEPNNEYGPWLYVQSITYTGDDVEVQVTADFKTLTKSEKDMIASSSQGIVQSYANIDIRPRVYVYNGENSLGGSKTLSANEYNWE
ncbi:hypothetical protein ACEN4K_03575 [Marinilactibacillus psychrotolerans]|uniref:hypothetical protein n=1 Tax=Marinilactibacillus psychrotolerans TaxID=191770 RepID=UPI003883B865